MALTDKLTAIADAIRGKTGGTDAMTLDAMAQAIASIETGGGSTAATEEYTADLSIVGFIKSDGGISTVTYARRTDYISTEGVKKIWGNAGFYSGGYLIALYDANKTLLTDISVKGSAHIATGIYGEGTFELDISGTEYVEAAYFVISTYRNQNASYNYQQTFADDFCRYAKLVDGSITIQRGSFTPAENLDNYTISVDGTVKHAILYKVNNTIDYGVRCMVATAILDGVDYQPLLMTNASGTSFGGTGGAKLLSITDGAVVFTSSSATGYLVTEQYNWIAW